MDKKRISLITLIVGIVTLIAGLVVFLINILSRPPIPDGEFLVQIGSWTTGENNEVVWNFTEIGKGKLTTNNHLNDYDFLWAVKDGKLKIETEWLYTLNDEYDYEIDQSNKILTIQTDDEELIFTPLEEQVEDNESEDGETVEIIENESN